MNTFRLIWLTAIQLPRNIANIFKHRHQQVVLNEREAERLDRIRNPSKYRGK
jgi:hypothetical protein